MMSKRDLILRPYNPALVVGFGFTLFFTLEAALYLHGVFCELLAHLAR